MEMELAMTFRLQEAFLVLGGPDTSGFRWTQLVRTLFCQTSGNIVWAMSFG